ncbi:MAG: adenine phosphoribosyltransferase [Verrucomicrobiales bacterium]|nr:adenine phosphoribosyltransferase [Verrucomicrobiales bacterium]
MKSSDIALLRSAVRDVTDFPSMGIVFKDITPLLSDAALFRLTVDAVTETIEGQGVTKIIGIDARGFIFAAAAADRLGLGFVPVRKKGKLPWRTESTEYDLEYGSNCVEIHADAVIPGERVWLVDDVLATGGTAAAAAELVKRLGGELAGMTFLMELEFLRGSRRLPENIPVASILTF